MITSYVEPLFGISQEGSPQSTRTSTNLAPSTFTVPLFVRKKKPTEVLMDSSSDRPDVGAIAVLGYN